MRFVQFILMYAKAPKQQKLKCLYIISIKHMR